MLASACADSSCARLRANESRARPDQTERVLASAQFQPEQEMAGVQFDCLLSEFQGERELLVEKPDPRRQPSDKPVRPGQQRAPSQSNSRPASPSRASSTSPRASQT